MQGKNRCINLILGPLNTGTYRLLKNLPPPPTGENFKNNVQHPVVFKTSRLQTLWLGGIIFFEKFGIVLYPLVRLRTML